MSHKSLATLQETPNVERYLEEDSCLLRQTLDIPRRDAFASTPRHLPPGTAMIAQLCAAIKIIMRTGGKTTQYRDCVSRQDTIFPRLSTVGKKSQRFLQLKKLLAGQASLTVLSIAWTSVHMHRNFDVFWLFATTLHIDN
jgi:hypothetical protein